MCTLLKEAFHYPRSLPFFFSTKPCGTKLFSGPLEAPRKRPIDGASTVRRLSLRWTRVSCILVIDRKKLWFPLPFFETKNEMRMHTRFARTCNIFRVSGVIVRMPYLPSRKVRWANSICHGSDWHRGLGRGRKKEKKAGEAAEANRHWGGGGGGDRNWKSDGERQLKAANTEEILKVLKFLSWNFS